MNTQQRISNIVSAELINSSLANMQRPDVVFEDLKTSLSDREELLGSFIEQKLENVRNIGEDLIKFSFKVIFENYTLHFSFLFFKPTNKWQVQKFDIISNQVVLRNVA